MHGRDARGGRIALRTEEDGMQSIVEYTDQKKPRNQFPKRIVSPLRSSPCCFTEMEEVGAPQEGDRWIFQYKRCRSCGFAVRVIVRELPNHALIRDLRQTLITSFVRNVPDF
jgi:hypothetical protein